MDIQLPCTRSKMVTTGKSENLKYLSRVTVVEENMHSERLSESIRFSEN